MQQVNLSIDGMTCVHCAKRVEGSLRRVIGVSIAHVSAVCNVFLQRPDGKLRWQYC